MTHNLEHTKDDEGCQSCAKNYHGVHSGDCPTHARSRPEPGGDDKLAERCNKFNDQVNQLNAEIAELKERITSSRGNE